MRKKYTSALLLLMAQPIHAQQVAESASVIEAASEVVVVTATRFEERNPAGTTVQIIDAAEIAATGQRFLPDLLQTQAGISVRDNTGTPDKQLDIRGFGVTGDQNAVIMVDGQRLSEHELASASWSAIPIDSVDRVEIVRGSASVLYGSGAVGGVINIITKRPTPGVREAQAYVGLGNYATKELRVSGALAGESIGLTVAVNRFETDNYRDNNEIDETSINLGADTLGTGARVSLRVAADAQDGRLPGARSRTQLITDRRGTAKPDDYSNRETFRGSVTGVFPFGRSEFRMDLGYRDKETTSFLDGINSVTQTSTLSASPRVRFAYGSKGLAQSLTLGVDWDRWEYDSVRKASFQNADVSASLENSAVYAQQVLQFPSATTFSVGGRIQRVKSEANDAGSTQSYAVGERGENLKAYEFILKQMLGGTSNVYAKLGRAFRIATLDEVYLPFGGPVFDPIVIFLDPQISKDREIGVHAMGGAAQVRLAAFRANIENEIHLDPVSFKNINYPPSYRYGAEFDFQFQIGSSFALLGNTTYTRARFREGVVSGNSVAGKEHPLVPRLKANLSAQWKVSERVSTNLALNWVGRQRFDNDEDNTFPEKIPAYAVWDARASVQWGHWTFAGEVRNLTNEEYFTYGVKSLDNLRFNAYPAAKRSFLLSGQLRF